MRAYDVFISYRRSGGAELAQLIRAALAARGVRAYLDVRDLGAGHFDAALLHQIEEAPNFVLILTPQSLEGTDEHDWLAREISHAITTNRNIVPVALGDFQFPDVGQLPKNLATLRQYQVVTYDHRFSDESMARLCSMLQVRKNLLRTRTWVMASLFTLVIATLVLFWRLGLIDTRSTPLDSATFTEAQTLSPLGLYWYGFGQREENGSWSEFAVHDGMTMYSGDQFRLVLSATEDCWAYVIEIGTDGRASILFPNEAISMDNRISANVSYEIPDGVSWFTLDDHLGVETLYLLASYDRVGRIEELIERESSGSDSVEGVRPLAPAELLALTQSPQPTSDGTVRTRDGKVVVRGVEIQPDQRLAKTALGSGAQIERPMQFEGGLVSVLRQIQIRHEQKP